MLYLAEVRKQKTGFMGRAQAELKLLAFQRTDQSWNKVSGEEVLPTEQANNFGDGALVIVNLSGNRQIQGTIEAAGGRLVNLLQNFSRLLEKSKNQEEEIEQWKQSLTYQSQELNRREMEMEARLEQMQTMEEDFSRIEQQRQELESSQTETAKLSQELERKSKELEGAWEQLRGQQLRLEEQVSDGQYSAGLDAQQAGVIQQLLNGLSGGAESTQSVWEPLNQALEVVKHQHSVLDTHWQQLNEQRLLAQKLEADVKGQGEEVQHQTQQLQQLQASCEQANRERQVQQTNLEIKVESARMVSLQLQTQQKLYQELARMAATSGDVKISQMVDIAALEKMPLGELQDIVQNLQQDLEKVVRFVNDQEEELTLQHQGIEELQEQIRVASEYDRISLETQLADEQDRYQMLDRTLVGQRRTLWEREEILNQHLRVLRLRQGIVDSNGQQNQKIDLGPILIELEAQCKQQSDQLQQLEREIEQMRLRVSQAEELMNQQTQEKDAKLAQVNNLEESWLSNQVKVAQLWGKVHLYEKTLQPLQDGLNKIRQKLDAIANALNHIQKTGDSQQQAIAQISQIISSLSQSPELAAS
ncbi:MULTISPECIES: pilus motility taxis protein HmpF [unclassified Moorena]|uniref:pilus motility taxis protein HmpF n=1 Tax=unclassified Moorena TaxID=2683338 RepID=UPI0025D6496B|nr:MULTISPECIES: pilus motility taxis protein HmpF [unclassified Moorena]